MTDDDLDPDFAALAAEARRLEPRVTGVSTHTSGDFMTVLVIQTDGLTTQEVQELSDRLKAFRWRKDLAADFILVNTTGGHFVRTGRP